MPAPTHLALAPWLGIVVLVTGCESSRSSPLPPTTAAPSIVPGSSAEHAIVSPTAPALATASLEPAPPPAPLRPEVLYAGDRDVLVEGVEQAGWKVKDVAQRDISGCGATIITATNGGSTAVVHHLYGHPEGLVGMLSLKGAAILQGEMFLFAVRVLNDDADATDRLFRTLTGQNPREHGTGNGQQSKEP